MTRKTGGPRSWILALLVVSGALVCGDPMRAQTGERRYFYAIERLEDGSAARRGDFVIGPDETPGRVPAGSLTRDSIILAPQSRYRFWLMEAATGKVGFEEFVTGLPGTRWSVRQIVLQSGSAFDADDDGLANDGEFIVGTNPRAADSDGDGVADGAEIAQGLDPLDNRAVRTGIIATVDTPGTALDVDAFDDVAVVANGSRGVSVFNVFNGMDPVIIAEVNTRGNAERVACAGRFVVVADGEEGLAIIDIGEPARARVLHRLPELRAIAIVASVEVAFVGTRDATIALIDVPTGSVLREVPLGFAPVDMRVDGDYLYALGVDSIRAARVDGGFLRFGDIVPSPRELVSHHRLFVGGGVAYAVRDEGYNTFSLEDPLDPVLIRSDRTPQLGWQQIVLNGSGLGVAVVGQNQIPDSTRHVSLYDTSDPAVVEAFLGQFTTPGIARAVTIYNGLAYVADGERGLQVLNYLSYDTAGMPPEITLETSFDGATVEEASLTRLTATVSDDVQVRNVEFHIDGVKAATDGNFPFEHRFITPRVAEQSSISIRARASDTGGNATWTDEVVVRLTRDTTPPRVRRVVPAEGSLQPDVRSVVAFFDELLDGTTLSSASFELRREDGATIPGELQYRDEVPGVVFVLTQALAPGTYRATIGPPLADTSDNPMAAPYSWSFTAFDASADSDDDCLPDGVEVELGLDREIADTDGDGTPDGDEDPDGDGLSNCEEIQLALDPQSDDTDGDGLADLVEVDLGLNAASVDSDADGFTDPEEIELGSDPLSPQSLPIDPFATFRIAIGKSFSCSNSNYPSAGEVRHAAGLPASVFSNTYPAGAPVRVAAGPVASVENTHDN